MRIKKQNIVIIFAVIVVFLMIMALLINIFNQIKIEKTRESCEYSIQLFLKGSDTLTNEVYEYADSLEYNHQTNYWYEANVSQSRKIAVDNLKQIKLSYEENEALESANNNSNQLMQLETHAMKLISVAIGLENSKIPEEVLEYELTEEELNLSSDEKIKKARLILFGRDYSVQKNSIVRSVEDFTKELNLRLGKEITKNLTISWIHIIICLISFLLLMILYIYLYRKNANSQKETLLQSEECFKIVANQTKRYVFRYDIDNNTYYRISDKGFRADTPPVINDFVEQIIQLGIVYNDDKEIFREYFFNILNRILPTPTDIRLVNEDDSVQWYRFDSSFITDSIGIICGAVISYFDCEDLRKKENAYVNWTQEISSIDMEHAIIHEWNLTKDILENTSGKKNVYGLLNDIKKFNERIKIYTDNYIYKDDQSEFTKICNREKLIGMYHSGKFSIIVEYREIQNNDEILWRKMTIRLAMYPQSNDIKASILFENIDEEKKKEIQMRTKAELEPLTGLLNRVTFCEKVNEFIKVRGINTISAMFMMDIDNFKIVNDTYGHEFGDQLLINVGKLLSSLCRKDDFVCRLGGDEFIVCICNIPNKTIVEKKAAEICNEVKKIECRDLSISISLGISLIPKDGVLFADLYHKADIALYHIKKNGKKSYRFYNDDLSPNTRN